MNLLIAIILAFIPSLIWLAFYLRRDAHPEPNWMIIRVFGASFILTTGIAFFLFLIKSNFITLDWLVPVWTKAKLMPGVNFLLEIGLLIFVAALFEEVIKYFVVRETVIHKAAFDEPTDAMEYMIISALGFACVENILNAVQYPEFGRLVALLTARFLGATLIHTVASGVVGFFLAYEIFKSTGKKRLYLRPHFIVGGLFLGAGLHAAYNWIIMGIEASNFNRSAYIWGLFTFLTTSWILVLYLFAKLNRESSELRD